MLNKQTNLGKQAQESASVDNVKLSNFYYEKIIYQKACQCGFATLVLALQIKCSYMRFNTSDYAQKEAAGNSEPVLSFQEKVNLMNDTKQLLLLSNGLSVFQFINDYIIKLLEMSWMKSKMQIHKDETFYTTGLYKGYLIHCFFNLIQPYWFLYGNTFPDKYNEHTRDIVFQVNDALTVVQIFITMFPIYVYIIELTNWTDPKAQRCCSIFGVKANFLFGLKALMIQDPLIVVICAFLFSLLQLSISLQIFEREVDINFKNITTASWNVIITLTTVGYGDYYPKTNGGRFIGIITAFWGVFFVSLFVVALTNILDLEESELRAFILLRRLFTRKILRENACRMIQSRYVIRTEEKKDAPDQDRVKIRQNQLLYKKFQSDFQQNYQRLLAMNDQNAQNDRLQIGIDQLRSDIEGLSQHQKVISDHLCDITNNYEEARYYMISKISQHTRWKKRFGMGRKTKKIVRRIKSKKQEVQEIIENESDEDSIIDNRSDNDNGSSLKKLRNKNSNSILNPVIDDDQQKRKKKSKPSVDNDKTPVSVESGSSQPPKVKKSVKWQNESN